MAARLGCVLAVCAGCHFSANPAGRDAPGSEGTAGGVAHHKVIAISQAGLPSSLANFPLWIDLVDNDLAAHATADGSDIHFVLPGGADLDYEVERWLPQTGELAAWVRVPALDASTLIELHYGDPASAHPANAAGVFAEFASVWHMDLTGTTVADATGNHPGTAAGLAAGDQVAGQLAGALAFDGSTKQITFTNELSGGTAHTISAWVRQTPGAGASQAVVVVGNPATAQARFLFTQMAQPHVTVGFYSDDWDTGVSVSAAAWTLLHWVFEGNRRSTLYMNGAQAGTFSHPMPPNTTGTNGFIGNAPVGFGTDSALSGVLDEVRIAPVPRAAAWIAAEFANQSSPSTFYSVGPEQTP